MKKQILMLVIGILIGAIITTGVFLIIKANEKNDVPNGMGRGDFSFEDGEMPEMDENFTGGGMKGDRGQQDSDNTTTEETTNDSNEL